MEIKLTNTKVTEETIDLEPCPFCGSDNLDFHHHSYGYSSYSAQIQCNECGGTMCVGRDIYNDTQQSVIRECITKWNRRYHRKSVNPTSE